MSSDREQRRVSPVSKDCWSTVEYFGSDDGRFCGEDESNGYVGGTVSSDGNSTDENTWSRETELQSLSATVVGSSNNVMAKKGGNVEVRDIKVRDSSVTNLNSVNLKSLSKGLDGTNKNAIKLATHNVSRQVNLSPASVNAMTSMVYERPSATTSMVYERPSETTSMVYERPSETTSMVYERPSVTTATVYERPSETTSVVSARPKECVVYEQYCGDSRQMCGCCASGEVRQERRRTDVKGNLKPKITVKYLASTLHDLK